jgi:DNA-binding NarL/FixJ family response regulator
LENHRIHVVLSIGIRREREGVPLASIRILVADDYEGWRHQARLLLQARPDYQVICGASDGPEAVQKAAELKPDLILLDVGLPKLNGLDAARQIRQLSPNSKILFLSQESSSDIAQEAFNLGAMGYIVKAEAGNRLLPAVEAVLRGERVVSSSIKGFTLTNIPVSTAPCRHEVQFYFDDAVFLDSFTRFIATALKAGNAAIVLATKSHRDNLLRSLRAICVDVDCAIRQGTYITLDAVDALSEIMVNGLPDPVRFFDGICGLIEAASRAAKAEHPRVAFCGERVGLLWAEGKTDAAIRLEQLCSELCKIREVDILCAYRVSGIHDEKELRELQCIREEHSAVHSQ